MGRPEKQRKSHGPLWYLLPFAVGFVVLGVVLFFVRPWAPLLLLASLALQLPIIIGLTRVNMNAGYRERAYQRRQRFDKDGDAAAWLAAEEREAASVGFQYWSRAAQQLSALNRAQPLALLGRENEAAALLAGVEERRLDSTNRVHFDEVAALLLRGAVEVAETDRAGILE